MLYSKLGSIPKPETDGTEGWIEVPEAPAAPEGKEVVWWFPPGWVIRDPKPEGNWNWSQSEEKWVEAVVETEADAENEVVVEGSEEVGAVGTAGSATSV